MAAEQMPLYGWSQSCGPHGVPNDELVIAGLPPACVCYDCYSGSSCQDLDEDCMAGDKSAIVSMNAPWFVRQRATPMRVGLGTGMPYRGSDIWVHPGTRTDGLSQLLNSRLRRLHALCDNVPGGHGAYRHLLIGAGAAQLLSAALHAQIRGRTGCVATAAAPYWGPLEQRVVPSGSAATWMPRFNRSLLAGSSCVVEFVVRPNNPDGAPAAAPGPLPAAALIHDLVYNWPAYGPVELSSRDAPVDVSIFTASKILGHASSRFGWAFVRDESTARRMYDYIWANGRCSTDAQLRHAQTLGLVLDSHGAGDGGVLRVGARVGPGGAPAEVPFMDWMHAQLVSRWDRLAHAFHGGTKLAIASHGWRDDGSPADYASTPRHMFMWLRTRDGSNCEAYLTSLRIKSQAGNFFGAPASYCRLIVGIDRSTFELLAERLERAAGLSLRSNATDRAGPAGSGGAHRVRRLGRGGRGWAARRLRADH